MDGKESFMTFPCDFPLKIIGKNSPLFVEQVEHIIQKYFSNAEEVQLVSNVSQHGNYIAITATIRVYDQATLDALYQELTQHPDMKMVL
jgi:hypothetical protein